MSVLAGPPPRAWSLLELVQQVEGFEPDTWATMQVILGLKTKAGNNTIFDRYRDCLQGLVEGGRARCAVYQETQYFALAGEG